jgi:hypothetical protein
LSVDEWWLKQFAKLLDKEIEGIDPKSLENRWLVLASMTWPKRGPKVAVDVPHQIYHILDDADIRAKDQHYAEHQWAIAKEWLNA